MGREDEYARYLKLRMLILKHCKVCWRQMLVSAVRRSGNRFRGVPDRFGLTRPGDLVAGTRQMMFW